MAYNSAYTGAQHDAYVTKESLINLIYPVGAIYISTNSTSPQTLFGGTWQAIEGKFLVGADSTYTAGGSGGSDKHTHTYAHTHTTPATTTDSHTLVESEVPAHTHTRGNMNITATLRVDPDNAWCQVTGGGAFTFDTKAKRATGGASGSTDVNTRAVFNASNSWSGNTSSFGGGAAIPTVKKPPQPTHKVQVRPLRPPIFRHISPYICGNALHNKIYKNKYDLKKSYLFFLPISKQIYVFLSIPPTLKCWNIPIYSK